MIYKRMIAIVAALLMAGCTTKPAWLDENRVACTADRQEAHVVSKWGLFSIGSEVARADAKVICATPAAASAASGTER